MSSSGAYQAGANVRAQSHSAFQEGLCLGDLRREGEQRLRAAGIDNAAREVLWLLDYLGISQAAALTREEQAVAGETVANVRALFARRAQHEPLQYLLGTQDFCGHTFEVGPDVLIPRPESERLVEEAVRLGRGRSPVTIVDIGTGSGCLAVSAALALPESRVWAVDLSEAALAVAERNIRTHGLEQRIRLCQGDLFEAFPATLQKERVDLLLSNPPYIADSEWDALPRDVADYEPRVALAGGSDGLRVHRRLVEEAPRWLAPGGWLLLEIGLNQGRALSECIRASGQYRDVTVRQDDQGLDRLVCARFVGV